MRVFYIISLPFFQIWGRFIIFLTMFYYQKGHIGIRLIQLELLSLYLLYSVFFRERLHISGCGLWHCPSHFSQLSCIKSIIGSLSSTGVSNTVRVVFQLAMGYWHLHSSSGHYDSSIKSFSSVYSFLSSSVSQSLSQTSPFGHPRLGFESIGSVTSSRFREEDILPSLRNGTADFRDVLLLCQWRLSLRDWPTRGRCCSTAWGR